MNHGNNDNNPRYLRVEANAMRWIDNEPNWRAWEIEMTGHQHLARVGHWLDNARTASALVRMAIAR